MLPPTTDPYQGAGLRIGGTMVFEESPSGGGALCILGFRPRHISFTSPNAGCPLGAKADHLPAAQRGQVRQSREWRAGPPAGEKDKSPIKSVDR